MKRSTKAERWFGSTRAERWFDEGVQYYQAGDPQKALAAFEQAAALYRALIDDNQFQYHPDLAHARMNQGAVLTALDRPEEALARYEEAAGLYQALIAAGQTQYRPNLAHTRMNEGIALANLNRPDKALDRYEEAAGLYQALIAAGQTQYRSDLARTRMNEGNARKDLNRPDKALVRYQEAADLYGNLIAAGQTQYRPNLAKTRMNQGAVLTDLNRPEEAMARHEEAASIYQALIAAGQTQYRPDLALTRMREGIALAHLHRLKEALARYEEAVRLYQALIAAGQTQYRSNLARTRMNEGVDLNTLNRSEETLDRYREAAALYQDLIAEGRAQYRPNLAHTRMNEGKALADLHRLEEALDRYQEAAALYQDLIAEGQPQHRPDLARTRMNEGNALADLHRLEDALDRYREVAALYQDLIAANQLHYRLELVKTLFNAAITCADIADGMEAAIAHLDRALEVWKGDEAMPAVALDQTPRLADLIHRTRSAAGYAARVEQLARQVARALGGVAPENLGSFYPLAEQAFARLFGAALDQEEWDLALTVIGTARAQRLAKLAQADLLRRAAREDDPAELSKYREVLHDIAHLEILLNVGAGPGGGGTTSGRGGDGDAGQQYQTLYNEYTDKRRQLDDLEQTLRQRGLLPDLSVGLFDGAGLRQKLPPQAALLLLVEVSKPPAYFVVALTRNDGHVLPLAEGAEWTTRLDDITSAAKSKGRALRDGPGLDTRTAHVEGNISDTSPVDTQTEALTEMLAEQFWQPIQGVLGDGAKTVWLLPTGDLHGLPWQTSAPPEWRCRLAPAPWFVRQALDRTPDPAPLRPTAAAPLGALTYAVPDSDKELLHMLLEESGMRAIWEDAARALAGLDQAPAPPPAHLVLGGHGDSDTAIPGAARILVGREGGEPRHVGFGELWNAPLPGLQSLYLSSCVVGRTREVNGEPLGLISAGLLRGARYLVGWSVPVDDLGAALFSLLYHSIWRDCADPEEALIRARNAFLTGDWPPSAVERARPLLAGHLRDLLVEWINLPSRQVVRKENLWKTLRALHEDFGEAPAALESWKAQLNAWRLRQDLAAARAAAETLAARILARRARFPFRYIGHFALGFGATDHPPADG